MHCDLHGNLTSEKPTCLDKDYVHYHQFSATFFFQLKTEIKGILPIEKCGCPQPCIQDSISYSYITDTVKSNDTTLQMRITVNRVRQTTVMVLTYELEDLLADAGGYLGLLLGASLLSVFGSGRETDHTPRQTGPGQTKPATQPTSGQRGGTKRH